VRRVAYRLRTLIDPQTTQHQIANVYNIGPSFTFTFAPLRTGGSDPLHGEISSQVCGHGAQGVWARPKDADTSSTAVLLMRDFRFRQAW